MFEDAARHCLPRLTDFGGRTSREHYLPFVNAVATPVVLVIVFFAIGGQAVFLGPPKPGAGDGDAIRTLVLVTLAAAGLAFALTAAATVRRLHDVGRSGWWMALLPLGGLLPGLILMVFLRQPSEPGTNRWGPPPADPPDPGGFRAHAERADARFAALLEERAQRQPAPEPPPGPQRRTFGRRGL
jgi:uncharacterized membrane protein YhaH (DUF805 family)